MRAEKSCAAGYENGLSFEHEGFLAGIVLGEVAASMAGRGDASVRHFYVPT